MKKLGLAILAVVMAHAAYARAEQWSKTYTISNSPDLRVETTDASIHVDTWDQKTIEATITSTHYKFGPGGLTVEERQSGDTVEINLRFPLSSTLAISPATAWTSQSTCRDRDASICTPAMAGSTLPTSTARWN